MTTEHATYLLYRIYHNLTAVFLRPYEDGDVLVRGHEGDVERQVTPEATCDLVYAIHNRDDRPDGKVAPSLSVGDVVSLLVARSGPDAWLSYTVDHAGWKRCSPGDNVDVIDGPYAKVAAKFRMAAEAALNATGHSSMSKPPPCTCDSCMGGGSGHGRPPPLADLGDTGYVWVRGSERARGHWRHKIPAKP